MRALHNILLIIIILISLAIGVSTLTRGHEWGDDFASYIMQAQSIIHGDMGDFIEHNTFTIFRSSFQIGPVAYPWGYPLALVPAILFKGVHPLALKLTGLIFFPGFLVCLYFLTEKRLTTTERLILISLFAFNPTLIKHLDHILSDIPFLFFTFLTLLMFARLNQYKRISSYILIGVAIFLAFFIRTTGIILLASFLAWQAYLFFSQQQNKKNIAAGSITVVTVFAVFWITSSLIFPDGQGAYFRQLMGFTLEKFFTENIPGYFFLFAQFLKIQPDNAWIYIYYALIVFFLIGIWERRNIDLPILLFFIFFFSAMIIWPEWQGIRFIFPIMPIFVYFIFHGIDTVVRKIPKQIRPFSKGTEYLLWLMLVGVFLFLSGSRAYSNLNNNRKINGPFDSYSGEVFNFIQAETSPDSVIVFFKPRAMRLFTNRDSIMVLECENLSLGDYIVLHKNWENSQILPENIGKCNIPLRNIFENQRFIVYETLK